MTTKPAATDKPATADKATTKLHHPTLDGVVRTVEGSAEDVKRWTDQGWKKTSSSTSGN